jgi:hypothetical protein
MSIRPSIGFDPSVEDGAAGKTSPLHVFDVRMALAVDLPDVHLETGNRGAHGPPSTAAGLGRRGGFGAPALTRRTSDPTVESRFAARALDAGW